MNRKRTKPRILRYEEIRDQIKNGDVLMYKGRGLISSIIQWATRSSYSHAGIAAWWNERLMVLEAKGRGVVASPFSRNVKEYRGSVEWFSCVREISEEGRLSMVIFAQEELGKRYGRLKTIYLGLKSLFERNMEKRDRLKKESKLFCSEYVAQIYNSIGMDLKEQRSDRFMKPGDIAESPLLERRGTLKLHSK
jgi:hypothetical protein